MNLISGVISKTIAFVATRLQGLQMQRFLAVVAVGFLLLTSNVDPGYNNPLLTKQVSDRVHQNTDQRPKTNGEWLREAEQDAPVTERIKQISEDSADAFKEFGSGYVKGAQKTGNDVKNLAKEAGKDISGATR